MSIIAGIWNLDGCPADRNSLSKTSQLLAEYGPDGEVMRADGPLAFLYRSFFTRLDERFETQPHCFGNGKTLLWDGRLDDRDELMTKLWGNVKDDRPDVVIVAKAFERWDTGCLSKLLGDWALVVWKQAEQELILARDFIGTKNLFYQRTSKQILWCNHLAALALNGQSLTLSEEYVAGYFAFQPDARLTPYQEIQAVPPGHFLRLNSSTTTLTRHWTFSGRSAINYKADTEYEEQFRSLFRQSVRRRLRTDRPILAELSGGLDSSSVVCMADDIVKKEGCPAVVDTFSSFDPSEPDEDDFSYFSRVEERRGTTGTHAELKGIGDSFSLFYPRFVAIPLLGERLEMKLERQKAIQGGGYRVVLSGTGGDEFLGQTLDPRVQMADLLMQWKFGDLWTQLMAWSLPVRRPWIQLLFQSATWFAPTTLRIHTTKSAKAEPWISNKFAQKFRLAELLLDPPQGSSWLLPSVRERMQTVPAFGRQLTNVLPSSYEVRYPFLDQTLVEFLLSIPIDQLLRPNERRSLMRRAFADLLPHEVVQRRTKAGAGRCYALTLNKHWNEIQELLNDPIIAKLGFVDVQHFRKSVNDMKNGHLSFTFVRLLRGLVLECWIRDVVKRNVLRIKPCCPPRSSAPCAERNAVYSGDESQEFC